MAMEGIFQNSDIIMCIYVATQNLQKAYTKLKTCIIITNSNVCVFSFFVCMDMAMVINFFPTYGWQLMGLTQ